jgi:broad specificity phosphatase PhoE
MPPCA